MKSEVHFNSGIPNGSSVEWYENGKMKEEGNMKNGQQTGDWTYYNEDGSLDGVEQY